MFGSGCYFANLNTNWLTPVYDSNASVAVDPNLKLEAKWELVKGPISLPLRAVYLQSSEVTDATFESTGVTNLGELQIPSGFVFEQRVGTSFAPGPIAPGELAPTYRVRKRAEATVSAIRPGCSRRELLPIAKGRTLVIDQRLAHASTPIPRTAYVIPRGVRWVSVEEAKQLAVSADPPRKSFIMRVAFVVLVLLPLPVILLSRKKRTSQA